MAQRPPSVTATIALMAIATLVWLVLGLIILAGAHPAIPDTPLVRWILGLGSLAAGAVLAAIVVLLWRRIRLAYFLGLAALTASALAIFFDDVGWADLLFLTLSLIPLFLLIKDRGWYLGKPASGRSHPGEVK